MAGMCCGLVGETETTTTAPIEPSSSRRRRLNILPLKCIAADQMAVQQTSDGIRKRQKRELIRSLSRDAEETSAGKSTTVDQEKRGDFSTVDDFEAVSTRGGSKVLHAENEAVVTRRAVAEEPPRFGSTSVCGRRRDMEDAVSIHPGLYRNEGSDSDGCDFYGVFDGHGCSHVALRCKERLHEIVKQDLDNQGQVQWKDTLERSFLKMDEEVHGGNVQAVQPPNCRCELQTPQRDSVGSTAVVALVTPEKIIVSNCGDSRAVLCRNGAAVALSSDHKPDRPDELLRIEAAGGRVIYWDGARVLGVLAMSRAIGDNYLKPYVIPEPEVTIMDRSIEDECLILASDGLWDVVSNDTACGVVSMCLRAQMSDVAEGESTSSAGENSDRACADASILLTKLALARQSSDNVSVVVVDLRRHNQRS